MRATRDRPYPENPTAAARRRAVVADWNAGMRVEKVAQRHGFTTPSRLHSFLGYCRKLGYTVTIRPARPRTSRRYPTSWELQARQLEQREVGPPAVILDADGKPTGEIMDGRTPGRERRTR